MSEEEKKQVTEESAPGAQPAAEPQKPKFSLKTWVADKVVLVKGKLFRDRTKDGNYISGKESRNIAKQNRRTIRELQKQRAAYKREDYLTQMKDDKNIVEFDDLHTYFYTDNGVVKAVNGVTFAIPQGSTVGVVGESGCGKSVTSLSLMQLVQGPMGQIVSGSIRFRTTSRTQVGTEYLMAEKKDAEGRTVVDEAGNPVMEDRKSVV